MIGAAEIRQRLLCIACCGIETAASMMIAETDGKVADIITLSASRFACSGADERWLEPERARATSPRIGDRISRAYEAARM
jgi:hypothetical protein